MASAKSNILGFLDRSMLNKNTVLKNMTKMANFVIVSLFYLIEPYERIYNLKFDLLGNIEIEITSIVKKSKLAVK